MTLNERSVVIMNKQVGLATALVATVGILAATPGQLHAAGTGGGRAHHKPTKGRAKAAPHTVADSWKPKPALLDKLGDEVPAGGFHLRLPTGYVAAGTQSQDTGVNGTLTVNMYAAPAPGNPQPNVIHLLMTDGSRFNVGAGAEGALEHLMTASEQGALNAIPGKQDIVTSPMEFGHIHGLTAARQYFKFSYREPTGGPYQAHGFFYGVLTEDGALMVIGLGVEPGSKEALPIMEAAALTIRQ